MLTSSEPSEQSLDPTDLEDSNNELIENNDSLLELVIKEELLLQKQKDKEIIVEPLETATDDFVVKEVKEDFPCDPPDPVIISFYS